MAREMLRLSQTCNLKAHISLNQHCPGSTCLFISFQCTSDVSVGFSGAALGARLCLASSTGSGKSFISLAASQFMSMLFIQSLKKRQSSEMDSCPLCLTWSHLDNHSKSACLEGSLHTKADMCMRFPSKSCY